MASEADMVTIDLDDSKPAPTGKVPVEPPSSTTDHPPAQAHTPASVPDLEAVNVEEPVKDQEVEVSEVPEAPAAEEVKPVAPDAVPATELPAEEPVQEGIPQKAATAAPAITESEISAAAPLPKTNGVQVVALEMEVPPGVKPIRTVYTELTEGREEEDVTVYSSVAAAEDSLANANRMMAETSARQAQLQQAHIAFPGLLYFDGRDSLGRPVVIINSEALHNRDERYMALSYIKEVLEPVVNLGPYVLIFVAGSKAARRPALSTSFVIAAYSQLTRPFKKNVQYIILVRPSRLMRALIVMLRPFFSSKAGRKFRQVNNIVDVGDVTLNEVMLQHLGQNFWADIDRQQAPGP